MARIAACLLNTIDWSPSAPALVARFLRSCNNVLFYALRSLDTPQHNQQVGQHELVQLLGMKSTQQLQTSLHPIAFDNSAPNDLRKSLLPFMALLFQRGFRTELRDCFRDLSAGRFFPDVAFATDFIHRYHVDVAPEDRMFYVMQCWIAVFEQDEKYHVDMARMAIGAYNQRIIPCLRKWSLHPGIQADPVKCA